MSSVHHTTLWAFTIMNAGHPIHTLVGPRASDVWQRVAEWIQTEEEWLTDYIERRYHEPITTLLQQHRYREAMTYYFQHGRRKVYIAQDRVVTSDLLADIYALKLNPETGGSQ